MRTCGRSWWQFKHTYSKFLRCMKAGPAFRESQAEIFNRKILVLFKQVSMSTDEMNHPFGGYSPDSKFTVYDTFNLYIYKMRVKAKILVRGVRQMNCNEIPDIWQMAVRRFSRVQSTPSCLYKLY